MPYNIQLMSISLTHSLTFKLLHKTIIYMACFFRVLFLVLSHRRFYLYCFFLLSLFFFYFMMCDICVNNHLKYFFVNYLATRRHMAQEEITRHQHKHEVEVVALVEQIFTKISPCVMAKT